MKIELTDQERRTLNQFVGENYVDFTQVAENFLSDEEMDELEKKLAQD